MADAWRLILDGDGSGPWNMGVDEALLCSAIESGRATFRLYGWEGSWLSLGYAQSWSDEEAEHCASAGVGVVRRCTGGRAVLHGSDLTYSVAAPESVLPEGLRPTYELLARALLEGLQGLGIEATCRGRPPTRHQPGPAVFDCFAHAATDELCVGDQKLVGSAQRRVSGAVLQHGSLRCLPDPGLAREATGLGGIGATSLAELEHPPEPAELRKALVAAFSRVLEVRLEPSSLTPIETELAKTRGNRPYPCLAGQPRGESQGSPPTADR